MSGLIDFSAQFGGRDAAKAVLPHFNSLKIVAKKHTIEHFPFKSLAFILRVDGDVNSYNVSGLSNIDFDKDNYVSVDLGVAQNEYQECSVDLLNIIANNLRSSVTFLQNSQDKRLEGIDFKKLEKTIMNLCDEYENHYQN